MFEYLKQRPWIWIIVFLGMIVLAEGTFFYVAGATLGDELKPFPTTAMQQR